MLPNVKKRGGGSLFFFKKEKKIHEKAGKRGKQNRASKIVDGKK